MAALTCNLSKCLVLCALMQNKGLISEAESGQVKRYLLNVNDLGILAHLARSFSKKQCLVQFRS